MSNYTKIKICGIMTPKDALYCADLGVDAIGFVCSKSPRRVSISTVKAIIEKLPPFISKVGVFVNEKAEFIEKFLDACPIDVVQLHGDETVKFCRDLRKKVKVIKVFHVSNNFDLKNICGYDVDAIGLDAYSKYFFGGTGRTFNWDIAKKIKNSTRLPIILSGGLRPCNIAFAIGAVRPYGVDVSSGVELSAGRKDHQLVKKFIDKVRAYNVTG